MTSVTATGNSMQSHPPPTSANASNAVANSTSASASASASGSASAVAAAATAAAAAAAAAQHAASGTASGGQLDLNGGRFDFDDGGTYCGGWEDGKAHGHGVCTGPKGQGEYSGSWHYGFEVSGIYVWPSGSTYQGHWQNGKRHGLGVEARGRWLYHGEWTQGFKGRYGVRQSTVSGAKYEGTWANGMQDGYGSETYGDAGTYQGQWLRGMRHGYGIRTSAPFGVAAHHSATTPPENMRASEISLYQPDLSPPDGVADTAAHCQISQGAEAASSPSSLEAGRGEQKRNLDDTRGGFVLRSRSDEVPHRRRSLVERTGMKTFVKGLKLKKQRSTGDLDRKGVVTASSIRSTGSTTSWMSSESGYTAGGASIISEGSNQSFILEDEHLDPGVTETYMGEWKGDRRSGFGISERSDGLKYEGEWYNNRKYGYGVTTFRDGNREEGKYKNNILITSNHKRHIFQLRSAKFRERIDSALNAAQRASKIALQKADIAISRTSTARGKAEQADIAALQAQEDGESASVCAQQYSVHLDLPSIKRDNYHEIEDQVVSGGSADNSVRTSSKGIPPPSASPRSHSHSHSQSQLHSHTHSQIVASDMSTSANSRPEWANDCQVKDLDADHSLPFSSTITSKRRDNPVSAVPPSKQYNKTSTVFPAASAKAQANNPEGLLLGGTPDRKIDEQHQQHQQHQQQQQQQLQQQQQQQQQQQEELLARGSVSTRNWSHKYEPIENNIFHQQYAGSSLTPPQSPYALLQQQPQTRVSSKISATPRNCDMINEPSPSKYHQQESLPTPLSNNRLVESSARTNSRLDGISTTTSSDTRIPLYSQHYRDGSHEPPQSMSHRQQTLAGTLGGGGGGGYNFQRIMDDHFEHYKKPASRPASREPSVDRIPTALSEASKHPSRPPSRTRTPPALIQQRADGGGANMTNMGNTNGENVSSFGGSDVLRYRRGETPSQEIHNMGTVPKRTESLYMKITSGEECSGNNGRKRKKSLPDVQSLPVVTSEQGSKEMTREEISVLSSSRRDNVRKQMEEIECYKKNPLMYILSPRVQDWISRQQLILLVLFVNLSLAFMFFKLLT